MFWPDNFKEILLIIFIAGVANMTPVFLKKLNFLNFPLDLNFKVGGQPILGKGKTLRGTFFGSISGIFSAVFAFYFFRFLQGDNNILKSFFNDIFWAIYFGFLIAFASTFGDLFKSFIKRRIGKNSGQTWVIFDQLDWIVGVLICLFLLGFLKIYHFYLIPLGLFTHLLFKFFGNILGFDDKPI